MTRKKRSVTTTLILGVAMWLAFFDVSLAERITDFDVNIEVAPDGQFTVTETITYDFESVERRGIYRIIDGRHAQGATSWYKNRYITVDLESVTMNDATVPFVTERHDGLSVRIGDANQTVTGVQRYQIQYVVDGAIATYDGIPELYWNVTGSDWSVPIERVSVTVQTSEARLLPTSDCYAGAPGSNTRCAELTREGEQRTNFLATNLAPGEQLTVAQGLSLPQSARVFERFSALWLWLGGFGAWFVGLLVVILRWRTHHRPQGPIITQYEPLPDMKPMYTGVLFDLRLDPRDVSAGIVYLAEQGFITIRKTNEKVLGLFNTDDYEITLQRPIAETETIFQGELLKLLFNTDDTPGTLTKLSSLRRNQQKQYKNAKLLNSLQQAVVTDLRDRGYIETNMQLLRQSAVAFIAFLLVMQGLFLGFSGAFAPLAPFIGLFIFSAIAFLIGSTRRTTSGFEALHHLKGFKEFLSVTDKERFAFHNAPERNAEQFMTYLPYAIAFGVEEKWTKLFADIQMEPPSWYGSPSGAGVFNAAVFSKELGAFTGAFATSSGSSGSSGSGSAGGGSGGGGGGSW